MPQDMRLYLIRHGETDWNKELRLQGREDIPLNETGKKQAMECGKSIKMLKVDVVAASPLQRARDTASMIAKQLGVTEVKIEEDLIERDFGIASGITYQEMKEQYAAKEDIPGVELDEQMVARMRKVLISYEKQYLNGHVLMVSHGAAINSLISDITDGTFGMGKMRLKNAGINVIDVVDGQMSLIEYNLDGQDFALKYLT